MNKHIAKQHINEGDGVVQVWDNTLKLFPHLKVEKRNNGIAVIGKNKEELITITGNGSYVESQLTIFLSGMIHGYNQKS